MYNLVGGLEHFLFFNRLGMSSSQLTNSYFQRGRSTTNEYTYEFSTQSGERTNMLAVGYHPCVSVTQTPSWSFSPPNLVHMNQEPWPEPGDKVVEDQVKVLPKPWRSELFDTFGVCVKIGATP